MGNVKFKIRRKKEIQNYYPINALYLMDYTVESMKYSCTRVYFMVDLSREMWMLFSYFSSLDEKWKNRKIFRLRMTHYNLKKLLMSPIFQKIDFNVPKRCIHFLVLFSWSSIAFLIVIELKLWIYTTNLPITNYPVVVVIL